MMITHRKAFLLDECLKIGIPRDVEHYSYKRWACKHGQIYEYNYEREQWRVVHFKKSDSGYIGCNCSVPCSPNENRAMDILDRHLDDIAREIGLCPTCGHNSATVILASAPHQVVIQCDSCGNPRIIDPERVYNEYENRQKKITDRDREHEKIIRDIKFLKNRLQTNRTSLNFYVHNRQEMINEVIKMENARIDKNVESLTDQIKNDKTKLKKAFKVLKNGKQTHFP